MKLLCGTTIANQLDYLDAVWILLVAPPSSGKTECLQAFQDIKDPKSRKPMFYPISDLTTNTFASGQVRTGEETSLLFKMPRGGMMSFKDFTSILSKNDDAKREIMGQLREIYDGSYVKRTGNNKDVTWKGKVGAVAGCTEIIYEHLESLSAMGDRFAMYSIVQPDRRAALKFSIKLKRDKVSKEESRDIVRAATKEYIEYVLDGMEREELNITPETEDEIINIADFCTKVRSGVVSNEKYKSVEFVPSREMPMRLTEQLLALATAFMIMRIKEPLNQMPGDKTKEAGKYDITANDLEILSKVAFDSIPIKRRMALKLLAKYKEGASTAGIASAIGYETAVVKGWLYQLNGLGICDRTKGRGAQGDMWKLRDEYVSIMVRFEHIQIQDGKLIDEKAIGQEEEDWSEKKKGGSSEFSQEEMEQWNGPEQGSF